jgi:hypothetical protein
LERLRDASIVRDFGEFVADHDGAALDRVGNDGRGGWEWHLRSELVDAPWCAGHDRLGALDDLVDVGLISVIV